MTFRTREKVKQIHWITIGNVRKFMLKQDLEEVIARKATERCLKGEKSSHKSFEGADEVELGSKPLILDFINSNFQ